MRDPRNPFRMRAAEQIESDATFLKLFGPGVLDLLPQHGLWEGVRIFQSAPGGGKTSLLRVFTPSALHTLHEFRSLKSYQELFHRLERLGVISENGPDLLGVMLSCARNYAMLEDIGYNLSIKERLLYALLNARLTLATLRAALALKKLRFPDDLGHLSIGSASTIDLPSRIPNPASGQALYEWSRSIEKEVYDKLDSFGYARFDSIEGHETLEALLQFRPETILCDGEPVASKLVFMFDDAHKLTSYQRRNLYSSLYDLRAPIGIWIAERLEALDLPELASQGATVGRDYEVIRLEACWRSKPFETAVINIADRRVRLAPDVQISTFAEGLHDSLEDPRWQQIYERACTVVAERISKAGTTTNRYEEWIRSAETHRGTARERAIVWRSIEILIERDKRRAQQLAFDFLPLPSTDVEERKLSTVRSAAEQLLAQEFDIPYYFGISKLAVLASSNIEQFLALAGDLFEEMISAALIRRQISLLPKRQEAILKKVTQRWWNEIPRRVAGGRDSQKLLEAIARHALEEWRKGTASYGGGGGVTGVGVLMSDWDDFLEESKSRPRSSRDKLLICISSMLSHNLLEARPDTPQGGKGRTWMVLYLNRWLCLYFGLPLQYGGWRPASMSQLDKWLNGELTLLSTEQSSKAVS